MALKKTIKSFKSRGWEETLKTGIPVYVESLAISEWEIEEKEIALVT